ncbi:MAG: UDP-3-O-(3-hydroxymyristoyl)glucosamine N-acyltransferase [Alphaproteobacteria bacterium]|nr:UDP-3-O-(3-hydroxymyristoyl)glucosamine N-acyltransferase [Alphaproteobacteria bacterium]
MVDPRFFPFAGPFRLGELAEMTGATLAGAADPDRTIRDVAALDEAGPEHLSFLENRRYAADFRTSDAGACLVVAAFAEQAPKGMALLVTPLPRRNFARLSRAFHPEPPVEPGVHPSAVVHPDAVLAAGVSIAAGAVIEDGAVLAAGVRVGSNAVIGASVTVGEATEIGAGASLSHCDVGARCFIYPGARIGQPGFGFEMDREGPFKMPQLGRVIIEDDVEIGANSTVDRGAGPDTVIGRGTMIDNLVQIGHNVVVGRGCIIVAQVGISGSTKLGDHVMVGGQVGMAGHLDIGDGVQIMAQSGVTRSLPAGGAYGGAPAVPAREFRRQVAAVKRLGQRPGDETRGTENE